MTDSGNTPQVQTPQIPTLLNNRYRVVKVLGDGGFGTTFLAVDMQMPSRRQCVIKQLKPIDNNPQIYQLVKDRFQREAAILERLGESHDRIPMLYAFLEEAGQFYLVEEWVAGQTLTQRMQQVGPLSEAEVRELLVQLLPVIDYIHQERIVHRDIKPDNIILRQSDGMPILIDFGAVKETMSTVVNSQGQTNRSIVVGTPGYMPMEQLAGHPAYSSDLYSLGLTAIYLLTQKIPQALEADPQTGAMVWQQFAPHLSSEFAAILTDAIRPHPHERFLSAADMMNRLMLPATDIVDVVNGSAFSNPESTPVAVGPPSVSYASQPSLGVGPSAAAAANPSAPAPLGLEPTQAVIPQYQSVEPISPATPQIVSANSGWSGWQKAVLTGSLIGLFALLGAWLFRDQVSGLLTRNAQSPESASDTRSPTADELVSGAASPTPTASPSPTDETKSQAKPPTSPPPVEAALPPNAEQVNASLIGQPGAKNIRSGPGTNYAQVHIAYPGDRVTIITSQKDQGGFLWHNVYFPDSKAQGWIAAQLIRADQTSPTPSPSPTPQPTPTPTPSPTNAIIVGSPESKNIRTGPGTKFPTKQMVDPGERVKIVGQQADGGGYLWYEVYVPASDAQGWIAAQLIQVD